MNYTGVSSTPLDPQNNPTSIRRLLRELNQLATSPPEGIRLAKETFNQDDEEDGDNEADLSNVRAWVEGPNGTPFEGEFWARLVSLRWCGGGRVHVWACDKDGVMGEGLM